MSIFKKAFDAFRYPGTRQPQAMFNKFWDESQSLVPDAVSGPEKNFVPKKEETAPASLHGGYRRNAPGTTSISGGAFADQIDVPHASPERMYDIKYYSRDTRRSRVHNLRVTMSHPSLGIDASPAPPRLTGSPGTFANPAVARYDESGLRSAMSATHESMNESISKYMPTHLPRSAWATEEQAAELLAHAKDNNLPPAPGKTWNFDKSTKCDGSKFDPRQYTW